MIWIRPALAITASLGVACAAALAQQPLHNLTGNGPGQRSGESVSRAGDFDGDGTCDVVVGAPNDNTIGPGGGRATVYSGRDGSVLLNIQANAAGDALGRSVSGGGDVNGDGFADVIVGAPWSDIGTLNGGMARVYSGADGSVLHTWTGSTALDGFGGSVSNAGDVDGDGYDDVIVGAPGADTLGVDAGIAFVYSGRDGSELLSFAGIAAGDALGWSVAAAGDVDGDCRADLILGAPGADNAGADSGSAFVVSGRTGAVIRSFDGLAAGDNLGWAVAGGYDVNGDGVADQATGSPRHASLDPDRGRCEVFSGADGSSLLAVDGQAAGDLFGWAISVAGDLDGDGYADVAVGAPEHGLGGRGYVFSGKDSSPLCRLDGRENDESGWAISGAGDLDGDGFADIIVGAPGNGDGGTARTYARAPRDGQAEVVSHNPGQTGAHFGAFMSHLGDVDNDGIDDYIVGAPIDIGTFGMVYVYSGRDHSLIRSHLGPALATQWGLRLGEAGYVNDDNHADYLVAGWHDDTAGQDAGRVHLYSGKDGSVMNVLFGIRPQAHMGSCMDSLGDINGDGIDDFFIGSAKDIGDVGQVLVYSGADISLLYEKRGGAPGEWFGWSGATLGDLNGDGFKDFAIGAPSGQTQPQGRGYVQVYSGVDGKSLYRFSAGRAGALFGWNCAAAGDVNGDGVPDVIIGGENHDPPGLDNAGLARVYSGADGSSLHTFVGQADQDRLGAFVDGAGDLDGDGFADFAIGVPGADPGGRSGAGQVLLLSGRTGATIGTLEGVAVGDGFGQAVLIVDDSNGDGLAEVAAAAFLNDDGGIDSGQLTVFESVTATDPPHFRVFGAGCPGSNNQLPRLAFEGHPALGGAFGVDLTAAQPNAPVTLAIDGLPSAVSLAAIGAPGCTLLVIPQIALPFATDPAGKAGTTIAVPNNPLLIGFAVHAQWLVWDSAANALGLVTSRGGSAHVGSP